MFCDFVAAWYTRVSQAHHILSQKEAEESMTLQRDTSRCHELETQNTETRRLHQLEAQNAELTQIVKVQHSTMAEVQDIVAMLQKKMNMYQAVYSNVSKQSVIYEHNFKAGPENRQIPSGRLKSKIFLPPP